MAYLHISNTVANTEAMTMPTILTNKYKELKKQREI
jgi:hypothetical protein